MSGSRWIRVLCCLAALGPLLLGCSSTTLTALGSRSDLVEEPPLGQVKTAEVGDSLVRTARVSQWPALNLRSEVKAKGTGGFVGNYITLSPGIFVARASDPTYDCYMNVAHVSASSVLGPANALDGGLCISRMDPRQRMAVAILQPGTNYFATPVGPVDFEMTTFVDKSAPGFSQELIYNGKSGQTVKFLYREFASDMARPAFDQAVEYDLNETHLIGFKSARIEVLEATNTSITYKVVAHFPRSR